MEGLQKILNGIVQFKREDFEQHKELFQNLGAAQKPHTLFIACSDSRVDPNLITKTLPGELFIIRNIANLVPPYRTTAEFVATTAAIEYAVVFLEVEHIIVCGHSNCGGCNACLRTPEYLEAAPHTKKWLELAHPEARGPVHEPHREDAGGRWVVPQEVGETIVVEVGLGRDEVEGLGGGLGIRVVDGAGDGGAGDVPGRHLSGG